MTKEEYEFDLAIKKSLEYIENATISVQDFISIIDKAQISVLKATDNKVKLGITKIPNISYIAHIEPNGDELIAQYPATLFSVVFSDVGYPVTISAGFVGTIYAEDREGLKQSLLSVFSHFKTGIKINTLIQMLDEREKENKELDSILK